MSAMARVADVLVVGLGAVGSAALYQLARRGASVIGIDRFDPPHEHGSSHGESRITRQAIGEGREFVPLVLRSNQIWEELEAATGRELLTRNGALVLAAPDVGGQHHGSSSFLADTVAAAREFGIAHQTLNADEIHQRYPQFRIQHEVAYFEPGAGYLRPEACIETQLAMAKQFGAAVHPREMALQILPTGSAVEVMTDKATYFAARVIVTVGPWITRLVSSPPVSSLKVYRQMLSWFALAGHSELYSPERFPVFIWITGQQPRDMLYGFPAINGALGGIKVATEQYEGTVDPDEVQREVEPDEIAAMHAEYVAPRFPDVSSTCLRYATCLYTVTPDARFLVDHDRESERVLYASACSGHGFKHSAALGEAMAQHVLGQKPAVDLSPFTADRLIGK